MEKKISEIMEDGRIFAGGKLSCVKDRIWNDHPTFAGVAMKHLLTGAETGQMFSSHLVRVKKGCEIGSHIHAGKLELHEVLQGQGKCLMHGGEIFYGQGVTALIPADERHSVQAGDEDLYLLAKFVPALL